MQLIRSVMGLVAGSPLASSYGSGTVNQAVLAADMVNAGDGVLSNNTLGDRRYLLFVPSGYSPATPAPVILSYHGGGRTADQQLRLDQLTDPFFNTEYIVVYPYGVDKTWQGVPGVATDDTGFTSALLDALSQSLTIDASRVFATGKSDGAGFVGGVLACNATLSARIAAFAPVSGAFYVDARPCRPATVSIPCAPGRAGVPVLEFHGGNDTTIDYDGGRRRGECLPSIPHWVRAWAERDGLGKRNVSSPLTEEAVVYEFGAGEERGLVTHVFDGASVGHDWPATVDNDDNTRPGHAPASFNASGMIVEFFGKHPLAADGD